MLMNTGESVSELHGVPFEIAGRTFLPMYHPAAALYTFGLRKLMEEDFRKLQGILDSLG
jgi:uracil-DNA glycosylase